MNIDEDQYDDDKEEEYIGEDYDDDDDDDDEYDDRMEEGRGDDEDIANDEYERRLDAFEEEADQASLLGIEIVAANGPSWETSSLNVTKKRKAYRWTELKGRGPTKGFKKANGPMHIQFDNLNRATGKFRLQFGQNVGLCVRRLNINWEWKSVSAGLKDAMWHDAMSLFHVGNYSSLRKTFFALVARRFSDFKAKLMQDMVEGGRLPIPPGAKPNIQKNPLAAL